MRDNKLQSVGGGGVCFLLVSFSDLAP